MEQSKTSENHANKAVLALILTASLWSLGGLFIKSVQAHPVAIAGVRSGIATVLIFLFLRKPKFIWTKAQWGSALAYVATVILFVSATKLTTAANAILLQYTAPIWVALFSTWFLKEHIRGIDWLCIALVIAGMGLFFMDSLSPAGMAGNLIAIASGVSFAWLALFLRKQNGVSTTESILLGNILTFLCAIPFYSQIENSQQNWIYLSLLGIFQLGIPYILYGWAIRHVTAIEGILIPSIEPILNPIWVALFFGERPTVTALCGGIVVLSSIIARSVYVQSQKRN